mgnify:CR=1|tara:strand:- start:302 stop:544 length:243 start_codon:yes stop_codon:yes gene_type:complete
MFCQIYFLLHLQESDITFLVEEEAVYAHGAILYARWPEYRTEYKLTGRKGGSTSSVEVEDMRLAVFLAFLEFVYTGRVRS